MIDYYQTNIIYVAITDKKIKDVSVQLPILKNTDVISLVAVVKHDLEFQEGFLRLGSQELIAEKADFKNEKLKENGDIGAVSYDAGLAIDFLSAYHKLSPWDDWYNPNYLDEWLIDISKKPRDLVYKENGTM